MRVKSLKVFVRVLLFGLLLGAWSTAHADTVVFATLSINLGFNPASGTAVFTPTGATSRARVTNTLGENLDITSHMFPLSQTTAVVTFANASVSAPNQTPTATSFVSVGGCTCTATSLAQGVFTGTLVILGGEGNVDVTFSLAAMAMGQVTTDQFGALGQGEAFWSFFLNGTAVPLFSQDQLLSDVVGPNQTGSFGFLGQSHPTTRVISLQFGAVNTIELRMGVAAGANEVNEVPEPASMALLVSGLGFMAGVLKKRRKTIDR